MPVPGRPEPATPYGSRDRRELGRPELDENASRRLDTRLKYLEAAKRNEFYIAIDTKKRDFSFHFADKTLRDAPVEIGAPQTLMAGKKKWTFAPLTGSFNVAGKYQDGSWRVPQWAYLAKGAKPPRTLPSVKNGLGKSTSSLGNDYVIHSPPSPRALSRARSPAPSWFPRDLAAIWNGVGPRTRVYIL